MKLLFITLCFLCCLLVPNQAVKVPIRDCGNNDDIAKVELLEITPYQKVKRGASISVVLYFATKLCITAGRISILGRRAGITIRYPLPNDDACSFMSCPICPGEKLGVYKNRMEIKRYFPAGKLEVTAKAETMMPTKQISCIKFDIEIMK